MNQLFTSDWHVDHYNVIKYCDRPFNTLDEMCDEFFSKLKEMWKRGSTLHVIGDTNIVGILSATNSVCTTLSTYSGTMMGEQHLRARLYRTLRLCPGAGM